MRHVFISYCHEDADFAQVLEDQLRQAGISVWKDLDLRAGDSWHAEIEGAIKGAAAVVVVLSERARASEYVNFEWAFAVGAGVPVLPLLLKIRAEALHPRLRSLQALDFSNFMLRPWEALTRSLKALADTERPFTVAVPRDAPPFIQKAARELDSQDAEERVAAVTLLAEIHDPASLEVLAEATRHPAADVRDLAAKALAEAKDLRALPAILDAIRYKRWDHINVDTLAELGDAAVPSLVTMLRDPAQGVHVHECIAIALGKMLNDESVEALHELMQSPEGDLRIQAVKSLAGEQRALPWILEATRDSETQWVAVASLKHYRGPEVVATLVGALKDTNVAVRQRAVEALKEAANASAVPALLEALADEDNVVRYYARDALANVIDSSAIPTLFKRLEEVSDKQTVAALLVKLKNDAVVNHMIALLQSEDARLRVIAAYTLGQIDDRTAVSALILALKDEDDDVRRLAAHSLRELKDPVAVPDLVAVLQNQDEVDDVLQAAAWALNTIGTREARVAYKEWERKSKGK
jgi:HEAT repeat protein